MNKPTKSKPSLYLFAVFVTLRLHVAGSFRFIARSVHEIEELQFTIIGGRFWTLSRVISQCHFFPAPLFPGPEMGYTGPKIRQTNWVIFLFLGSLRYICWAFIRFHYAKWLIQVSRHIAIFCWHFWNFHKNDQIWTLGPLITEL